MCAIYKHIIKRTKFRKKIAKYIKGESVEKSESGKKVYCKVNARNNYKVIRQK